MRTLIAHCAALALTGSLAATGLQAQSGGMDHSAHAGASAPQASLPSGQDAYATIAAVIALLEADSTTDWSKVNIEALRQHLITMNEVTLRAQSRQTVIPAGARMDVTGEGHVVESIRAMLRNHSPMLADLGPYRVSVDDIPGGARWTVTATDPSEAKTVAKIRSLGFSGLLTLGAHHEPHHVALARGQAMSHRKVVLSEAKDPHRPERGLSIGMLKVLRSAQDERRPRRRR